MNDIGDISLAEFSDAVCQRNEIRAENARLRSALQKIAKDPPSNLDEPDLDWEVIQKYREIARKALTFSNGDRA